MEEKLYIRFDWAMKRLLRNKANYDILEGFLSTLLGESIRIERLLESESNRKDEDDKQNRVDLLAENSKGELIIIEIQGNNAFDYYHRMLFATSTLVTEYINSGDSYEKIRKVYSVNIVYFSLGVGTDIVYHGKTEFRGLYNGDILELSPFQRERFHANTLSELYPEYYILKVNDFNKVATTPLEEWISYLKSGKLPEYTSAQGLDKVRERLNLDKMTKIEQKTYYKYLRCDISANLNVGASEENARLEGREEGMEIGMEKGREEGILVTARAMKANNVSAEIIAQCTGLSYDEIAELI